MNFDSNYETFRDFSEYFSGGDYDSPLHFHRSIEFMFVERGEKPYSAGNESGTIKDGQLLIVPPFTPHSYQRKTGTCRCNVLPVYYSEVWNEAMLGKAPAELLIKDESLAFDIENHLKLIDYSTNPTLKDGIYKYALGKIFASVKFVEAEKVKIPTFVTNALTYIEENLTTDIRLETAATKLGYSKYYFSNLFNEYFQTNFRTYVNKLRIDKAKRLLSNFSIDETSYRCGYKNLQSFFLNFKKFTGMTPKEFLDAKKNDQNA